MILQFKCTGASPNLFQENAPVGFVHDFDRDAFVRGGNTIAYVISQDGQSIYFSLAKCHKRDQYNKKVGRELALEYARRGKIYEVKYVDCCPLIDNYSPAIKFTSIVREMNFHWISKKYINIILRLSAIKLLGRHFFNFENWRDMVLESPDEMPLPCIICPNLPDISEENELSACDNCDMKDLLIAVRLMMEDGYDEDEADDSVEETE